MQHMIILGSEGSKCISSFLCGGEGRVGMRFGICSQLDFDSISNCVSLASSISIFFSFLLYSPVLFGANAIKL